MTRLPIAATVSKRFKFAAAHSLNLVPDNHKCRRLHGHNYIVEAGYHGAVGETGMVVDYAVIDQQMKPIVDGLDHQNLNDILTFETTAENIALWILGQLNFGPGRHTVKVFESDATCAEVSH